MFVEVEVDSFFCFTMELSWNVTPCHGPSCCQIKVLSPSNRLKTHKCLHSASRVRPSPEKINLRLGFESQSNPAGKVDLFLVQTD